jgi:hypothetical protein
MALFLTLLEKDELFTNQKVVYNAMNKRNNIVDGLTKTMLSIVDHHSETFKKMIKPELIDKNFFTEILPTITIPKWYNLFSENNAAVIEYGQVSISKGFRYNPICASEKLDDLQSFNVYVSDAAYRDFMIGVAAASIKSTPSKYADNDSICIYAKDGTLYLNGTNQKYNFQLNTFDRVTVRRNGNLIEWLRKGEPLCAAPIPNRLRKTDLFPIVWIRSYLVFRPSKLQFVW